MQDQIEDLISVYEDLAIYFENEVGNTERAEAYKAVAKDLKLLLKMHTES